MLARRRLRWTARLIPCLLLASCAAPSPEEPAPEPRPPFRLELSRGHKIRADRVSFRARLVPEPDAPPLPGTLYLEKASFPEAPIQAAVREKPPWLADQFRTVHGGPRGFTLEGSISVSEVPPGATSIPEIVVEIPVDRILEFEERQVVLEEGRRICLRLDPIDFRFECYRSRIEMYCGRPFVSMGPASPEEKVPWMESRLRDPLHLLRIEDATGSSLRNGGTSGHNEAVLVRWVPGEEGIDAALRYPVTATVRYPIRWERTVHRFVLKDVPVPKW